MVFLEGICSYAFCAFKNKVEWWLIPSLYSILTIAQHKNESHPILCIVYNYVYSHLPCSNQEPHKKKAQKHYFKMVGCTFKLLYGLLAFSK
jgi:hypothetical protein